MGLEDIDEYEHLTRDDATFVDVIHTDAGKSPLLYYGYAYEMGTVDFWVNDGSATQPGCPICLIPVPLTNQSKAK